MEQSNSSDIVRLDGFCPDNDPFWDPLYTWNTNDPNFTSCFRKTILLWFPCGFFWLFLPLEIYKLFNSKCRGIPFNALGRLKMAACVFLILIAFIDLGYGSAKKVFPRDIMDPVIRVVTFLALACLYLAERARGRRISGFITTFFFFFLVVGALDFYGHVRDILRSGTTGVTDVTFFIHFVCVCVSLVCHFFVEPRPIYEDAAHEIKSNNPCPVLFASFPSLLTFTWFDHLTWTGFKRNLSPEDIWDLVPSLTSPIVVPAFLEKLNTNVSGTDRLNENGIIFEKNDENIEIKPETKKKKPVNIFRALVRAYGPATISAASIKLISDSLNFVPPLLLKRIIKFVTNEEELWKGIFYSLVLFISATLGSLVLSRFFYKMYVIGMKVKTSVMSTIYRKAIRVPTTAKKNITTGEIVNLMSVDVQKIVDLIPYINTIWSSPFQITVAIFFLWKTLGPSIMAGVLVMILIIPFNGIIAAKAKKLQTNQMKEKDERLKLLNEVIQGIKIVKLYAWERSFLNLITGVRSKEISILRNYSFLQAANAFIWTCAPFLVSLVTFATYILSSPDHVLDSEKAFVCLTLFNILRFPLSMLPMIIGSVIAASVSVKRINRFMNSEEIDDDAVNREPSYPDLKFAINVEKASWKWESEDENTTLTDISLDIEKGNLVAVVGTVGSGKSSLLSAILGEMKKITGNISVCGSVGYAAQQAWVQNASLKDNILFSKPFDKEKYDRIVEACALKTDLGMLPSRDETEIGEKGINLSGGQKQRVSLARAVYSDADIMLLDDPLSAVDAHVGKHIYEHVISNSSGLLKNKTRIVVTHGVTYLPYVDKIIVIKDGKVSEVGTYKELLAQKGAFAEFIVQFLCEASEDEVNEELKTAIETSLGKKELEKQISIAKKVVRERSISLSSNTDSMGSPTKTGGSPLSGSTASLKNSKKEDSEVLEKAKKQYQEEKSETGSVKWSVYIHYIKNMGIVYVVACVFSFVLFQTLSTLSNVLLAWWSDSVMSVESRNEKGEFLNQSLFKEELLGVQTKYLSAYCGYGFGQAISVVVGFLLMYVACLEAAKNLHAQMLINVLRSPMSFFDTTPQGRILNRLGKDLDVLDTVMPMVLRGWISCFFGVIASILVVVVATPIFIFPASVIVIGYYFVQRVYISTSRQLKRFESSSRSPIYSYFGETINGAATIRAYNMSRAFIYESERKVDDNQKLNYPATVANRWLAIRLEAVGNLIVFSASLLAVLGRDSLSPGIVGLSVSYALSVTTTLNWLVRMASEVETNIVAVERIQEYKSSVKEAKWDIDDTKPDQNWPHKGEISFKNYSTRYREGLDLVLKDISLDIEGGQKVGIVGRTGAGKSSFTLALFRIIEPAKGNIYIDGVDISTLGLHQLRSKLTVIPQDPVLFSGSLRLNIDPLKQYDDAQIWTALNHSHLKTYVDSLKEGLEFQIAEGGDNLSVGQRQLICLARALLRKTKVLILDEATAAVDLETDNLIQKTIREEFVDSTVITIAHRLNTIMDYDRILVLENGKRVEYGTTEELLSNQQSVFYSMCSEAGIA